MSHDHSRQPEIDQMVGLLVLLKTATWTKEYPTRKKWPVPAIVRGVAKGPNKK